MTEECMNMNQNEIWLIEFSPNKGDEMGKTRPAIIINDDKVGKLNLRTVVPITDWKERFIKQFGIVSNDLIFDIHQTVAKTFDSKYVLKK